MLDKTYVSRIAEEPITTHESLQKTYVSVSDKNMFSSGSNEHLKTE